MTRQVRRRSTDATAFCLAVVAIAGVVGCGSPPALGPWNPSLEPSQVEPTTPAEAEALRRAPTLEAGAEVDVAGSRVLAGEIYSAASGRRCRQLGIDGQQRLACEDTAGWEFVPSYAEAR